MKLAGGVEDDERGVAQNVRLTKGGGGGGGWCGICCGDVMLFSGLCAADNLNEVVQRFCARKNIRNAAAEYGLEGRWKESYCLSATNLSTPPLPPPPPPGSILVQALNRFSKAVCGSYHPEDVGLKEVLMGIISGEGHVDDLFPFFLAYARQRYPMLVGMPQLQRISDLAHPTKWSVWFSQ